MPRRTPGPSWGACEIKSRGKKLLLYIQKRGTYVRIQTSNPTKKSNKSNEEIRQNEREKNNNGNETKGKHKRYGGMTKGKKRIFWEGMAKEKEQRRMEGAR